MKLIAIISLWLVVSATLSRADTVRVASGEHVTFSRLVLYFSEPVNWRFGRSDRGYILEYDGPALTFNTEDVFRYIPRNRISEIEQDSTANRVEISIACTCTADAFELRDGVIVLDIKDGAPDAYSRFEDPINEPRNSVETPKPQALASSDTLEASLLAATPALGTPDFTTVLSRGDAKLLQTALLENLSKAMSEGVVDTQTTTPNNIPTPMNRSSSDQEITATMGDPEIEYQPIEDPLRGVSIHTQVELDASRRTEPGQVFSASCPSPSDLDISSWGDPDRMVEGLGQRRNNLVSAALQSSSDGVVSLARYYVWLGFGTEARAVMALHDPEDRSLTNAATAIHILSGVIDGLSNRDVDGWKKCQGSARIWAFLASRSEEDPLPSAKMAIIRAFEGLPDHLKHHLGQMLFDRFIAIGDKDAAETIRRSMSRSVELRSPQIEFLDAQTLLESGDTSGALHEFARLAKGSDTFALQALVVFAETSLESATELPEWAVESLRAQAAVLKGTPDRARIEDLLLAHLIADDRVGEVASYLNENPFGQTDKDQARMIALLEVALPKADDTVFSELAVRNRDLILRTEPAQELRTYIVNRFDELGFETTAASFQLTQAPEVGGANPGSTQSAALGPRTEALVPRQSDEALRPDASDGDILSKLRTEPALPRMNDTGVSVPESQDLLAAARTRRQLVNELLSAIPSVD